MTKPMTLRDILDAAKPTPEEDAILAVVMSDIKVVTDKRRNTIILDLIARLYVDALLSLAATAEREKMLPPVQELRDYVDARIALILTDIVLEQKD